MKKLLLAGVVVLVVAVFGMYYNRENESTATNVRSISIRIDGTAATYFGNAATGDLNGDGVPDVAYLVTTSPGGSGTFFYVVAALKTASGYSATNALLLGDRIAPQTTEIVHGEIIVNYADRKLRDPMTTPPSVGVSKHFTVVGGALVESN